MNLGKLPKREAILAAAKEVFMREGFQPATMDAIAIRAQTTKRTIYDNFKNKEDLFKAVVEQSAQIFLDYLGEPDRTALDYTQQLENFATRFCELVTWQESVSFQRVIVAEAERFSEIGLLVYNSVDRGAQKILARYLTRLTERGLLNIGDAYLAATQFLDVTTATTRFSTLFGAAPPLPDEPQAIASIKVDRKRIRASVELFLRAHLSFS
ncbi:MAG: TetR/AcrR family transcriptional regulator [Chroococcidiopsidaceae cyanobacterium CP_BM_ER_R8_30]|nr:TetR/AcrR family transcriptional regulator [Chroococcidiopsidaceae cyanobacterium CP_BM_ER_R8_30]